MKIYVACDEPAMMRRLRSSLHELNADWGVYSSADARALKGGGIEGERSDQIILYASLVFGSEQISRLKEIHEEMADEQRLVVLGNLPDQAVLLELMDVGIVAFIDFANDLETGLRRQLDRLTIGRTSKTQQGRLIAVIPSSGGCGASFLATNLAAGIAGHKQSCCLIDLKSRGGDLATILRLTPRYNILSLAANSEQVDRAMFEQSLIKHDCGVQLLAGPDAFSDSPAIAGNVLQRIVRLARSIFTSVVIELDDVENADSLRILGQCERIVVPLRLDFTSLRRTKRLLDRLEQGEIPLENVLVVANRCGEARQFRIESVEQLLEVTVLHQIPDAAQAVNESVNLGTPLVTSSPRSKIGASILEIVDKILNRSKDKAAPKAPKSLLGCFRITASRS